MINNSYFYIIVPFCVSVVGAVFYTIFIHKYALGIREYIELNILKLSIKNIERKIHDLSNRIKFIETFRSDQHSFYLFVYGEQAKLIFHLLITIITAVILGFVTLAILLKYSDIELLNAKPNLLSGSLYALTGALVGVVLGWIWGGFHATYLFLKRMIDDVMFSNTATQKYRDMIERYETKRKEKETARAIKSGTPNRL